MYVDPSDAPGWSDAAALRIGGWPVSAGEPPAATIDTSHGIASAVGGGHTSTVVGVVGVVGFADESATSATAGVRRLEDATPLGEWTAIPWLQTPPRAATWTIAALALNGGRVTPRVVLTGSEHAPTVAITWPDGVTTQCTAARRPPHVCLIHLTIKGSPWTEGSSSRFCATAAAR